MPVYPKAAADASYAFLRWYRRPRPSPYLAASSLTSTSGAGADAWSAAYTTILAKAAYAFGDSPNRVQIQELTVEGIDANDVIVMEFYSSPDATNYTAVGAVRFSRTSPQTRSFTIACPTRDVNIDVNGVYCRTKSAAGGTTTTFSVSVGRFIQQSYYAPASTGTWPTG